VLCYFISEIRPSLTISTLSHLSLFYSTDDTYKFIL